MSVKSKKGECVSFTWFPVLNLARGISHVCTPVIPRKNPSTTSQSKLQVEQLVTTYEVRQLARQWRKSILLIDMLLRLSTRYNS